MEAILKSLRKKELSDKKNMQIMLDKDMNVPENLGDIAEIAASTGNLVIDEDRVVGDKIYVKGNLSFNILYVTEEEQKLESLSGKIEFDEVIRIDSTIEGMWRVSAALEDVGVTIIHPRKISVNSLVMINALCCGEKVYEIVSDLEDKEHVECLLEEQSVNSLIYSGIDRITVKEEVGIMNGNPNIARIIYNTCSLMECESTLENDYYVLKGKIALFIIYQAEDSEDPYALWEQEIPFEREVEAEGIDSSCKAFIKPNIGRVTIEVGNDDDGEARLIVVSAEISCDAEIYSESKTILLRDAYATDGELTIDKDVQICPVSLNEIKNSVKINDRITLPEGTDDVGEILHVEAEVTEEDVSCDGEGIHIAGVISLTCYYRSNSETVPIRVLKQEIEFVEHMPVAVMEDEESLNYRCSVYGAVDYAQVRQSGNGEFEVKAAINLSCLLSTTKEMEYITNVDFEESQGKKKKQIVCYYVKEDDTLFDIGRKYRVKQEDIMRWNTDISLKKGSRIYMYTSTEVK